MVAVAAAADAKRAAAGDLRAGGQPMQQPTRCLPEMEKTATVRGRQAFERLEELTGNPARAAAAGWVARQAAAGASAKDAAAFSWAI